MSHLKEAVLEKSFVSDGKTRLRCADAFSIAEKLDVRVSEVGTLCQQENIRICTCQLKCF